MARTCVLGGRGGGAVVYVHVINFVSELIDVIAITMAMVAVGHSAYFQTVKTLLMEGLGWDLCPAVRQCWRPDGHGCVPPAGLAA